MTSKIIIITTLILLVLGFSVLFVIEARNHNYDFQKNWSVVYFANPGDNSLDFAIENHQGEKINYSYKILSGDTKVGEGNIEIEKGAKKIISPQISSDLNNGRITIIVSAKDREYKIYKNIR